MKIHIENFQSLRDVEIEAEGLTVLVGPSDRGKSAAIRAIEGALYNRAGDSFVRTGASAAVVEITDLPGVDGQSHTTRWKKGKNANDFTLDGQAYTRVGSGAPPALQEWGYRDVWVGDKERKKGESLRPQVAGQFDPMFLLTRQGSFLADVLNLVTRQVVLQTAVGRAAGDLSKAKASAGTLRRLLDEATTRGEALQDVPALEARVLALQARWKLFDEARHQVTALRQLAARRQALSLLIKSGVATLARRPAGFLFDPPAAQIEQIAARLALLSAIRRRTRLRPTATATLPSREAVVAGDEVPRGLQRAGALRRLNHRRARLATVPPDLPAGSVKADQLDICARGVGIHQSVHGLAVQQAATLGRIRDAEVQVSGAVSLVDEAEQELAAFREANPSCPTCGQPWREENS